MKSSSIIFERLAGSAKLMFLSRDQDQWSRRCTEDSDLFDVRREQQQQQQQERQ